MAEGAVVKVLLQTVTKLALEEAKFLREVKGKIDRLQTELEWMHLSIIEADEALVSDEKLKLWVKQARGIIFDTEDVIDEFILEIAHPKRFHKDPTGIKGSIRAVTQLPSMHEYGNRVKEINTRVIDLKANKEKYWFESAKTAGGGAESSYQLPSLQQKIKEKRAAIAAEEIGDGIHIHEDSVRQLESLLKGDEGSDDKGLRVISILGMGGVGKTTLSKNIYNLMRNFGCRMFVYISKSFRMQEPLNIIKCFPSISRRGELSNEKLHAHLRGKKYMIVLDDVWDKEAWEALKSSFPDEQTGSRVLLTTRHEDVAFYASSSNSNIHKLSVINEEESWRFFLKKLFPSKDISTSEQILQSEKVEVFGKKMVGKCHGLPLAIVVLVGLLLTRERTVIWWRGVNKRASWHLSQGDPDHSFKFSGILALSYDYLPYYLKPCFLYMSLSPEDTEIRGTKLFQYWIAEGLVQKQGEATLEDIAEKYLEELIRRSLIMVGKLRCDGRVKTCRIHSLLRNISIAESEGGQFSRIYGSIDEFYREQDSSRRAAIYCEKDESNKKQLIAFSYKKVRSLICQRAGFIEGTYLGSLFGGFKSLRVLEIYKCTRCCVSLPKEVGELIHLRYLSFEKTKLKQIDTSFLSKLVNLQTLNLKECNSELKLDDQIWSLRQLRNLYLDILKPRANRSILRWTATADKLDIGNLTNLRLLVIQAGDWINSGALKRLSSLRKLRIEECLSSHSVDISNAVISLTELQSLALIYKTSSTPLPNEGEPLTPIQFSSLTFLKSLHYKGEIHRWTTSHISFPPDLCKLKLESLRIKEDPMQILEMLPCLTSLHLGSDSFDGVEMVCSKGGFVSLETLEIFSLKNLAAWIIEEGALTSLGNLEICKCIKFERIPDGFQYLKDLQLKVVNMPLLFQNRLNAGDGEDWDKIKHLPPVDIQGWSD
ncbi:hypothetical protein MKW94_027761 [Papaver nudicaule]|uniref:Uncharacterized protein n=1 Tax=Papaver nudicaule TaxID=74823 RepID=A0AA41V944_PAPNU|nr:hypothetical protein [Papaver nudicaule]